MLCPQGRGETSPQQSPTQMGTERADAVLGQRDSSETHAWTSGHRARLAELTALT